MICRQASAKNVKAPQPGTVRSGPRSPECRRKLITLCKRRFVGLATRAMGNVDAASGRQRDTINQRITVKSAEANCRECQATDPHEVAEIAVVECMKRGIFVAGSGHRRRRAQEACSKKAIWSGHGLRSRPPRAGSPKSNRHREARPRTFRSNTLFEDNVVEAVLREPRARLELEKTRAKTPSSCRNSSGGPND